MERWRQYQSAENHNWRIYDISDDNDDFIIGLYDETALTSTMHSHEFIQIYYIQDGMLQHEVEGGVDFLSKGDVFLIPPGVKHLSRPARDSKLEYFSIGFMPSFVDFQPESTTFLAEFIRFILLEHTIKSELAVKPRISFGEDTFTQVNNLVKDMLAEFTAKKQGYMAYEKGQLLRLLVLVTREYTSTQYYATGKTAVKYYSDAILKSIQYVDANFSMDLKIEDMTKKFLLSRTYFCEFFKKFTGCTFNEYLSGLRISHAKKLLATTDMNVTEVAIASGFNDISNFCRQFAKQINASPSEYRKMVTTC